MNKADIPPIKHEIIEFHGHQILTCEVNGMPHVMIKSICDAIGVHADSAGRTIKKAQILGGVRTVQYVRDASTFFPFPKMLQIILS